MNVDDEVPDIVTRYLESLLYLKLPNDCKEKPRGEEGHSKAEEGPGPVQLKRRGEEVLYQPNRKLPEQLLKAHLCLSCASSVLVYVLILPCFEINLPVKQNIFSKRSEFLKKKL